MLRVPVHNIQPGMILARPIPLPHDPYRYLLQRDVEIPMDLVPRLKQLGILEVWIRHRDLEFLEEIVDEGLSDRQRDVYVQVRRNFTAVMQNSAVEIDLVHFQSSISELFNFLKASANSGVLLQKLDAFDNYLISHCTNVCYLALLLGIRMERYLIEERQHKNARDAKDIHLLGLGCLLHDVGKIRVRREILDKPGRLTAEEAREMRRHTLYGYEMVKGVPAPAAQVVLNHHQRYDGKGYPGRTDQLTGEELPPLAGKQIPIFSRMAILADVYDATTTKRCYSPAKMPIHALHEMRSMRGFFDPVVEAAFYRAIPPFPIGQIVKLNNGYEAVVIDFSPEFPTRPKVQCLRTPDGQRIAHPSLEEIDLSLHADLGIVSVDGHDVRRYLDAERVAEDVPVLV
ncbi:MAG: HD domain-containing phosphohydrolase [Thermoguttaceae bacterium]|jgi:HD-GYP domain-containing protein (c-di-GMP phosphodiesterase class II)